MQTIQERLSVPEPDRLVDRLSDFIRKIVQQEGRTGCVLGNSGGVDSAVVAAIALHALGREHIRLFFLPERDTHKDSRRDANLVAKKLGLEMLEINITPILRKIGAYRLEPPSFFLPRSVIERYARAKHKALDDSNGSVFLKMLRGGNSPELQRHMSFYRVKNRVRMSILYLHAELRNSLVLGTCNRSEKMTGLFIKHGDGACDLAPLDDLYKTQVFELARHLGVPREIIEKPPIGDLSPGITDEESLKIEYAQLDRILAGLDLGLPDEIIATDGVSQSDIDYLRKLIAASESMRHSCYAPIENGAVSIC